VLSIFQLQTIENVDWESILTQIKAPILVITADPELGAALTPEGAAALKEYVPHLREEHISEAGHNIRREQFKRYIEVVLDFLVDSQ
jgi:pimeloyl-ACP methyl ester carboxylesterase